MPRFDRQVWLLLASLTVIGCCQSTRADDAFAAASQLYQAGQWQQAAAAFDRIAQDGQPPATRLAAQLYAGEALMQQGDLVEARQRYLIVHQQQPPARLAAQALFRLGEVAWMAGDYEAATQRLESYLDKYPLDAATPYAQQYLQQIRARQSAQLNFAELDEAVGWERDGRHDAALAAYRQLLEQHTTRDLVRSESLRRAAKLHHRLEQSREAIELYQQFLAEFPQSEKCPAVMTSLAWLHDRLDQTTQAADQFRGVHAKFPQSAQAVEAAYWLALNSADNQDSEQAMRYVDWVLARADAATRHPQWWAKALCLKCQWIARAGQWQQIDALVAEHREHVDDGPLRAKLGFWAAEAAFRLRKYQAARERFNELKLSIAGIRQSWTAMVPLRRAQLAARRQQWSEVLKILDQLEQDHPEFELDYEIDYLRGRALAGRGKMTAARKFYRRVLDNEEASDTEAATMVGWMIGESFFHQRDYTRARSAYEEVIASTTFAEWRSRAALQAGKCWELEQRWNEAAEVYSTALTKWPNSSSEQELESRLRWAESQSTQQR
ncbi:MAG: tetratricopeptide repeat protein [Bythopirellula sp.]